MKNLKTLLGFFALLFCYAASAQLQVDRQIQLTGNGSDAKLTGIQQVSQSSDATNVQSIQQNALSFATAGGSSNAYTVSLSPAISGYTVGMIVHFIANFANTGAATLNVNGFGAATIKKNFNADLAANDIKSGQAVSAMYDGTNFQMLSQLGNSSGGGSGGHAKLVFTYTGGNQFFYVPVGVTSINVKLWGAGGASGWGSGAGSGGGGAFLSGTLSVNAGDVYCVMVGGGGGGGKSYGGGGSADDNGGGGGRSALQLNTVDILTAGGGGGASGQSGQNYWGNGGGGGAPNGSDGTISNGGCGNDQGLGGTTTAGGAGGASCVGTIYAGGAGSQYTGGNSAVPAQNGNSGAGGGGYYGGGAGGSYWGGGGGGGSSYYPNTGFTLTSNIAGATIANGSPGPAQPGGNTDTDYTSGSGVGLGGVVNGGPNGGGNGCVVISW